jgi:4-amino-4-deoxy-L-arabinose transferase-like glycosyltransferase
VLVLASLLVRGSYLAFGAGADRPLIGDEPGYHGFAAGFLAGEGWHDGPYFSTRPPLTSWLLTLVYSLVGVSSVAGRWTMVAAASLVAPLVFLVARRLLGPRSRAPLWAGALWVVYPPAVFYSASLVTENLAALLCVAGLACYLWTARARGSWPAVLTGLLWAGAALNRPSMLLVPIFFAAIQITLARRSPWAWSGRKWVAAAAAFVVALAPWTARNLQVHGVVMPVTSYGGIMFSSSNASLGHPVVQAGGYYHAPGVRGYLQSLPEAAWGSEGLRLGLERIRDEPGLFLEALLHRGLNFWTPRPDPYDPRWTANDLVMSLIWIPTLVLSVFSIMRIPWQIDWPLLALIAYTFLVTLPFWGTPRFRYPVDALVLVRAAGGAEALLRDIVQRRARPREAARTS